MKMLKNLLKYFKHRFPGFFRIAFSTRDWILTFPAHIQLLQFKKKQGSLALAYLGPAFPRGPSLRNEFVYGGAVKLTYLAETFPHCFPGANLLYAVSSVGHPLRQEILNTAQKKGLKIIVNQNGVAFPAWDGANFERTNQELKKLINCADFIVYQSRFCKDAAERYISPPQVPHAIIYNPVDTRFFRPDSCSVKPQKFTLLLGGNQFKKYRLELALQTLQAVRQELPEVELIITGKLWQPHDEALNWVKQKLRAMNIQDCVKFTGPYTQAQAPEIFSQAHVLLHTQYADSSPGLVLEALSCGLPVIYLNNGGVPELVGPAGIGVLLDHSWDVINLPTPEKMAEAVLLAYDNVKYFSEAARQRAVEHFSLEKFVSQHAEIFSRVLAM